MYTFSAALLLGLPLFAASNPIDARAGGPGFVPVANNCTVYDVLTGAIYGKSDYNATVPNAKYYKPKTSLTNSTIYSFYSSDTTQNTDNLFKTCLEQCNYFSNCASVMVGKNVTIPKGYYGASGNTTGLACLALAKTITVNDVALTGDGSWADERSGVILCPKK